MSMRWSWIRLPSGSCVGFTKSVAPNLRAQSSLLGFVSTAMTRAAPIARATAMQRSPTGPAPKTTTVSAGLSPEMFATEWIATESGSIWVVFVSMCVGMGGR